jgi:hypothetical protein
MKFLLDNFTGILIGIVSSLIVLLLQGFIRVFSLVVAAWIRKTGTLGPIWGFQRASEVYVVSGSIQKAAATLLGPDADAANESIATMRFVRPNTKLIRLYSTSQPPEETTSNVIAIGGPVNNAITQRFMSRPEISKHIVFAKSKKDPEIPVLVDKMTKPNSVYEPTYQGDEVESDYGLILKLPNPLGDQSEILILAGCDTHGVLAAARSISLHPDANVVLKAIRKHLGLGAYFRENYFAAIVHCIAVGNDVTRLKLVDFHPLNNS